MPDYEAIHRNNIQALSRQLEKQYLAFAKRISTIANDPRAKLHKSFKFVNNRAIQEKVDKLTGEFNTQILETISAGIVSGWELANTKNDALVRATIKSAEALKIADGLNNHNLSALQTFLNRKENGLNLSDRVWKIGNQFRDEMEMHLQLGILNGDSANIVSRRVRQYLNDPDKLFRRVRDDHGRLVLSNAAKQYHPGQGVYRSSYKNARRTAATETNMAYRKSDHERWKNNPSVVGFEIKLSAQHPRRDICDDCKGKYPKSFVFSGWHPHCFCYQVPIMLSDDEFDKYIDSILEGKEYNPKESVNQISDTPKGFKDWVSNNKEKIKKMKNPPYWVKDNFKDGKIGEGLVDISPVKFILGDNDINKLYKAGFTEITTKGYQQHMGGFDLVEFDARLSKICVEKGIKIETKILQDIGVSRITAKRLIYKGKLGDEEFKLIRVFSDKGEGITVYHEEFKLPKSIQNQGLAKEILKIGYKQYKQIGVTKIDLHAGHEVGGYVWAKYGFKAKYDQIDKLTTYAYEKMSYSEFNKIDNFFKGYKEGDMIDMFEIANMPFGKKYLLGSDWAGQLDLTDEFSLRIFEKYLYK